jgi:hypothetical protein
MIIQMSQILQKKKIKNYLQLKMLKTKKDKGIQMMRMVRKIRKRKNKGKYIYMKNSLEKRGTLLLIIQEILLTNISLHLKQCLEIKESLMKM